jgi:beta-glucanase (GH16 family)
MVGVFSTLLLASACAGRPSQPRPTYFRTFAATPGTAFPIISHSGASSPHRSRTAHPATRPPRATPSPGVATPGPPQPRPKKKAPRPPVPINWGAPVFTDDFDGATLNTANWDIYDNPSGTPPRSPAAVQVRNGELQLIGGFNSQGQDVSGGISMKRDQKYGRWEVRFREDVGAGYSAGVLLWPGGAGQWPIDGEIDIAEVPSPSRLSGISVLHNGPQNHQKSHGMAANFSSWHTVAVDWLPDHVTFWLDGVAQWTEDQPSDLIPTTSVMHLALQNDEGCNNFIPCRNSQTPRYVVMHVDWVKVYSFRPGVAG